MDHGPIHEAKLCLFSTVGWRFPLGKHYRKVPGFFRRHLDSLGSKHTHPSTHTPKKGEKKAKKRNRVILTVDLVIQTRPYPTLHAYDGEYIWFEWASFTFNSIFLVFYPEHRHIELHSWEIYVPQSGFVGWKGCWFLVWTVIWQELIVFLTLALWWYLI